MARWLFLLCSVSAVLSLDIVINTWAGPFESATSAAYKKLKDGGSSLDAVETGCTVCEANQCDGSVGYGNHPDTQGFTTLDALIMDGATMDAGSVGFVRAYRNVIALARYVMTYTDHTLIVGEGAETLAKMIGHTNPAPTTTQASRDIYNSWVEADCQPNFYRNLNGSSEHCGPYTPLPTSRLTREAEQRLQWVSKDNHDTIGIIAKTSDGNIACGTSTNGASHKVSGRLGDSPIIGAGCYASNDVGGAAATGDGDIMMRFLPSYAAWNFMRAGLSPQQACEMALSAIPPYYPSFQGGIVCLDKEGRHGAATYNMMFSYSVASDETNGQTIAVSVPELIVKSIQ